MTLLTLLTLLAVVLGVLFLSIGFLKLVYVPLAIAFEVRAARHRARPTLLDEQPRVSIVVPAFDEEKVLENCVHSIMASAYRRLEVIVVDDGSTDGTPEVMARLQTRYPDVLMVRQPNAGKGAALNRGAALSHGEVLIFVDADSLFRPDTVQHMLRGFDDPSVGAVCGDDRPVNLDGVLPRMLTVLSHVGTGLVRRALSLLGCLPIVSGNSGAFRRDVFERVGAFATDTVGEDLELTWRVHRAGLRVRFAPLAQVFAESPSTVGGLWAQRARWARGLLQTTRRHLDMVGNPRLGVFGVFLALNTLTMIIMPVLQIVLLALLVGLEAGGAGLFPATLWGWFAWLGLLLSVALAVTAIALDRTQGDLRHLWTIPLWPLYSVFISFTMVRALQLEIARRPARWNKLERTGVVDLADEAAQPRTSIEGPVGEPLGRPAGRPLGEPVQT